jgi:outer membrane protein assembly factor BamD
MTKFKYILISLIFLLIISCSKNIPEKKITVKKEMELEMLEAYNQGVKELERGDALFAAKKFNEAEILFPQSDYAPRAALMAAYSYYTPGLLW